VTEVSLRPETAEDEGLSRAIYSSTREEEMARVPWSDEQKAAFVSMQFEAQRSYYREVYPDAAFSVVVVDGTDAGRLYVDRAPEEIRVVDIAVLPAFRGRGVGGTLLGAVLDEARETSRKVVIHVEHMNRARTLYDRLGFVPVDEVGVYIRMEWTPPQAAPAS
jgi:ribosomal protein S18 acetylase RimI-like enzyme